MASYQGFVQRWGRHVTQCEGWWLLAGASGSTGQTGASGQTGLTGGLRLWRFNETSIDMAGCQSFALKMAGM